MKASNKVISTVAGLLKHVFGSNREARKDDFKIVGKTILIVTKTEDGKYHCYDGLSDDEFNKVIKSLVKISKTSIA